MSLSIESQRTLKCEPQMFCGKIQDLSEDCFSWLFSFLNSIELASKEATSLRGRIELNRDNIYIYDFFKDGTM